MKSILDLNEAQLFDIKKKIDSEFPVAAAYLNENYHVSTRTPMNERDDDTVSSSTLKVYPSSGEYPDIKIATDIYFQCQKYGEIFGVQDSRLQFVVNDEEGVQRVVRSVKLVEPEEYVIELTASCGQKVVWLFDSKDHYLMVKDMLEKVNYLEKSLPEFIQDEPIVTRFST